MSAILRRAGVAVVATLLACLGLAGPAAADPPTAGDFAAKVSAVHMTPIDLSSAVSGAISPTYSVVTPPADGTVTFAGSVAQYRPLVGSSGTDEFTYQVTDGADTSGVGTVSLTFNQAPTATDDGSPALPIKIAATNATQLDLGTFVTDPDDSAAALTYSVVDQPVHGQVAFAGSVATFTPQSASTPTGYDSFSYDVSDGLDTSGVATVTVVYNSVPQAQNESLTVSGISSTDVDLAALSSDADGDAMTFTPGAPAHGTVTGSSTAHFTPPPLADGFFGADPFTYTVSDGFDSATATISLRVNDVPVPVGPSGTVAVPFNSAGKSIPLSVTDADSGQPHTFSVVGTPTKGTVQINGSTATYIPTHNAVGPDSFSFKVGDGIDFSPPKTVNVNIAQAPDNAPVADGTSVAVAFDGQASVTLPATDPDGDPLLYSVSKARHGTVSGGNGPVRTYTADKGFAGTDSFTFTATDPDGKSDSAQVTVTVSKASADVHTVMFSPSNPTPGAVVTAHITISTPGSVTGAKLTVQEGSRSYATTMTGKSATVRMGALPAGKHTFKIRYGGTKTTTAVAATALPFTVRKAVSSLRVASAPKQLTTSDHGVATVHVSASGGSVDGALVTIKEASKTIGSAVVRGGVAKITLPKFGLGQHNLTVSYAGNKNVTAATKAWVVRVALG